ncbi:hypothetical protein [Streptomyces chrestomyceticus]|uniref:hypothetical protein n=1 Tax=Streptomyces chrestomyceticus TaxID=68185 RepID=UPI0019CFE88B|nr:hypothetical protein [Streptomyces chrestomyceticus]
MPPPSTPASGAMKATLHTAPEPTRPVPPPPSLPLLPTGPGIEEMLTELLNSRIDELAHALLPALQRRLRAQPGTGSGRSRATIGLLR